jgi:hypothetical protein
MVPAKSPTADPKREMLRHTVATLAYRAAKSLANAPADFARFKARDRTRTPEAILTHMGDLFDWALRVAQGDRKYTEATPLPWDQEVARFFAAVKAFDDYLASDKPLAYPPEQIFQAPIADALTHVGQLAMLRGMADAPVRGESYIVAEIAIGRVGPDQSAKRFEFD